MVAKQIGIIGGMGPQAGLDLHQKVLDETLAVADQDHIPVVHVSFPAQISDRTAYLLEGRGENPAGGILDVVCHLEQNGVAVAGMPCNTAHSPEIRRVVLRGMLDLKFKIKLLNMIEETAALLVQRHPNLTQIALLATNGTCRTHIYQRALEKRGLTVLLPEASVQERVQAAIYDPEKGIKAKGNPVTDWAKNEIRDAIAHSKELGAQAVILGCTELPLAITDGMLFGLPMIDPARALARALIREAAPDKLRD